jgi:transcriptional regulator with XRE-family HTH domain
LIFGDAHAIIGTEKREKDKELFMKLCEKIYTLRTEKKLSQGDLAELLDVSRQSVSKWETGASIPDLDKLIKMSDLFGVSLDALVREEMPENEQKIKENSPKTPENGENPQNIVIVKEAVSMRKIVGLMLLAMAFIVFLIIGLLGDFLTGILFAMPFVIGGFCALAPKNIKNSVQTIVGVVLFFVSVFLLICGGGLLAIPFFLISMICLFVKKYPLLWILLMLIVTIFIYIAFVEKMDVISIIIVLGILSVFPIAWLWSVFRKK